MKHRSPILSLSLLAFVLPMPLVAQEKDAPAAAPGKVEDARAAFVLLRSGPAARVHDADDVILGTVHEHVCLVRDGRITHAVLDTAVSSVLVPFERFEWGAEGAGPILRMSALEVSELPVFDDGLWGRLAAREATADPTDSADPAEAADAEEAGAGAHRGRMLASALRDARVQSGDELFGTVRGLVLDPRRGRIAFVLITTGSATPPVIAPWSQLRYQPAERPGDRSTLVLAKTLVEMADAPRIDPNALASLSEGPLLKEVRRFYGLPNEAQDAKKERADADGEPARDDG